MTESVRKSLPLQDGVNSLFCHELVIGGFIHKAVQFGRISQAQAKKPAVLLRIAVDARRLIFQRAVHFNDYAGNRHRAIRTALHASARRRRKNQPSSSASLLTSAGSSSSALFTSTTSPEIGA